MQEMQLPMLLQHAEDMALCSCFSWCMSFWIWCFLGNGHGEQLAPHTPLYHYHCLSDVHIFLISNTNNSAFAIPPEHVFIGFRNYVIDTTAIFGMFFWKLFPSFSLPTQLPYIGLAMMNNIIPRIGSSVEQEFNKLTVSLVGPHHPRSSTHDACNQTHPGSLKPTLGLGS